MPKNTTNPAANAEMERLADLAREQANKVLTKLPMLGPVAWLMMQQGATRHAFLSELEWRVLPPLVLEQAKLYMKDTMPIAFVSWAKLSADAAERFRQPPHRLGPADWMSGDQVWIVDLVAPFGNAAEVLKDLRENVFPSATLRQLAPVPDGPARVIDWPPARKVN
jgi:cytolysin-activating lysine-acyltransferase